METTLTSESIAHANRQPIPETPGAALAALPWFKSRAIDAHRAYERAKRDLMQARGGLAIVRDVADGKFGDRPSHAVGSSGAWPVDDEHSGRTALREVDW